MRRAWARAGACGAVALLALVNVGPAPAAPDDAPARLLVTADEWSLVLSRAKIEPGPAIVELYNRGEDPHDVRIKRGGRSAFVPIAETASQSASRVGTRFKRGKRYVLFCSLEGHRELGMEAELRAKRR